jgi:hypothetical protein
MMGVFRMLRFCGFYRMPIVKLVQLIALTSA